MKLPAQRRYWRLQNAGRPLTQSHRSQIGLDEDDLGTEEGTSATKSFTELKKWAQGGHANWIGEVDIVQFWGVQIGRGADREPIVIPVREVARYRIVGGGSVGLRVSDQLRKARTVRDLHALRLKVMRVGS